MKIKQQGSIMTDVEIQVENDVIIAELKKHFPNHRPRLTMTQSNGYGFRGLHIHMGLGQDHFVVDQIRDINVLIQIVRAFGAAHRIGRADGVAENRGQFMSALGITVENHQITYVD
jgi:hypothetical protein